VYYKVVEKKSKEKETIHEISNSSNFVIPTFIFQDDRLTVLEAIVTYLKEKEKLNYHEIGVVMNRDERNIWTVYNRSKKKRGISNAAK
jgi:hypothetical protein